MAIQNTPAMITKVTDLSPTAKEVTLTLTEPITFQAGAFVNIFMDDNGEKIRRAFSISSDDGTHDTFTLSIRESLKGRMSPMFWKKDMLGVTVTVMGPLGMNTADKMKSKRIFLFGFGIGVGVVKSLAAHFASSTQVESLTIATGSRNNADVMYTEYFNQLVANDPRIHIRYVVTEQDGTTAYPTGYIQDNIDDLDFNNADVYVCGQEVACTALQDKVKSTNPENCNFFVEAFH